MDELTDEAEVASFPTPLDLPDAGAAPVAPEPDWGILEASFNEKGAHQLVGASGPTRLLPSRVGLNKETMVGAGGFEPP